MEILTLCIYSRSTGLSWLLMDSLVNLLAEVQIITEIRVHVMRGAIHASPEHD